MRYLLCILFFVISLSVQSQSLRDSLFGGKMKVDSALLAKSKQGQTVALDSAQKKQVDSLKAVVADSVSKQPAAEKPAIKYADNNKIWKKFVDEQTKIINAEVLPNKKIKKGGYTLTLEYEIGIDGAVSTKNIICDPKNEILTDYIRDTMMSRAPQLAPQVVNGAPRKSSRRQVLVFVKEKN